MKIDKIMTDLLKRVYKGKTTACNYGIDEDYVYYTPDGYRMFKIDRLLFLVDLKKALPTKTPLTNPSKFFKADNLEDAYKSKELRVTEKNETIVKIANDKAHAWINNDYLKDFNPNCTFKIVNHKSPVFIYENEEVVGMILPVYIKEENDD